jgi:hypothetical protein
MQLHETCVKSPEGEPLQVHRQPYYLHSYLHPIYCRLDTTVYNERPKECSRRPFVYCHLQLGKSVERPDPAMGLALAETPTLLYSKCNTHGIVTCCFSIWD